jgi:protein-S-isoprenylcysteine O-methyltransferase Ste14
VERVKPQINVKRATRLMSSASQQPRDATTASVANAGVVRPPVVVLASLLLGTVLTLAWPLPFFPRVLRLPVGGLLVTMAGAMFTYSIRQFRAAGTPVPGNKPTTTIVYTGPYRCSRNPIYLAFFALHLGVAIWVNSLWLIATLIATVAIIAVVVVSREERYLTGRFGAEYLEYKASVRRWL